MKVKRLEDGKLDTLAYFGLFWQDGKLFIESYTADLDGYGGISEMKDVSDQYEIISYKQDLLDIIESTENVQKLKRDIKCYFKDRC